MNLNSLEVSVDIYPTTHTQIVSDRSYDEGKGLSSIHHLKPTLPVAVSRIMGPQRC